MSTGSAEQGVFHPSRRPYRFTLLFVVAMLIFGSYFAFDSIGAIATELVQALGIGRSSVGTMYSMYSVGAILVLFVGGVLVDRLGMRISSLLFNLMVTLGAGIVAMANKIGMIYVGRLIFGAGSETLIVAQNAILTRWFRGRELALAFGIALTVSRLGTLFTFNTEALIAKVFGGYRAALVAAVIFCGVSLLCNLLYIVMDRYGERVLELPSATSSDRVTFSDIGKFGPSYWYVTLLCLTFYSAVFPFTDLATDFFHVKWGIPATADTGEGGFLAKVFANYLHMFSTAGGITSIPTFASMCLAPFAGHFVDRIGRRATLMIIGSGLLILAHLLLGMTNISPAFPMMLLGAGFVLVPAAMWPAVPLIVAQDRVGTAYGLTAMIQNVGLFLFPLLNGLLFDKTQSYRASEMMFVGLGLFALFCALKLKQADRHAGGVLERPGSGS